MPSKLFDIDKLLTYDAALPDEGIVFLAVDDSGGRDCTCKVTLRSKNGKVYIEMVEYDYQAI